MRERATSRSKKQRAGRALHETLGVKYLLLGVMLSGESSFWPQQDINSESELTDRGEHAVVSSPDSCCLIDVRRKFQGCGQVYRALGYWNEVAHRSNGGQRRSKLCS